MKADLEVTADDKEVNALPFVDFAGLLHGGIDGMKGTMTLSLRQLGMVGG